jgi:hypothetical protein
VGTITIDERVCGPPGSANGGYTCGLTAEPLGPGAIEVTLRRPPPLGRTLERVTAEGVVELRDADDVVARAVRADAPVPTPGPVSLDDALAGATTFDVGGYRDRHAYPRCFTCGPDREEGDGLRLFPGATERPDVVAWPWTPTARDLDGGRIATPVVWAALDCPGGTAWLRDPELGAIVLGRLTVEVRRRPGAGERLVVGGWTGARVGRKLEAGTALWSATGEILAAGHATWVELTPDQAAAFGATRGRPPT